MTNLSLAEDKINSLPYKLFEALKFSNASYTLISEQNKTNHSPVTIPSWDEYFMAMAVLVSMRSKDSQTKHGCVIVNEKKRIVGTGYNSFPSGMDDQLLPNLRPTKYSYIIHAESNAIKNTSTNDLDGCRAYITGFPCLSCLTELYQKSIVNLTVLPNACSLFKNYTNHEKFMYIEIATKMNIKEFGGSEKSNVTALLSSALQSTHLQ